MPIFGRQTQEDYVPEASVAKKRSPYKQFAKSKDTQQAILDYLKAVPEGTPVSQSAIATQLGFKQPSRVSIEMGKLLKKRAITRKGKWGQYVYTVKHGSVKRGRPTKQAPSATETVSKAEPEATPESAYVGTTEQFAWQFVKETGSTKLHEFLTWLSKTVKK